MKAFGRRLFSTREKEGQERTEQGKASAGNAGTRDLVREAATKRSEQQSHEPFKEAVPLREEQQTSRPWEGKRIEEYCKEKRILPLRQEEIEQKNRYFAKRYDWDARRQDDGTYQVDISLKGSDAVLYTNFVDVENAALIGKSNYPDSDIFKEELGQGKRMRLSDIKYQTWRLALEQYQQDHPQEHLEIGAMRPRCYIGKDIMESNIRSTAATFSFDSSHTCHIHRGTPEYETVVLTTLGKSYLYLTRQYFSDQSINHVTIQKAPQAYQVHRMLWQLEPFA